jgi:hypothetical protein
MGRYSSRRQIRSVTALTPAASDSGGVPENEKKQEKLRKIGGYHDRLYISNDSQDRYSREMDRLQNLFLRLTLLRGGR